MSTDKEKPKSLYVTEIALIEAGFGLSMPKNL